MAAFLEDPRLRQRWNQISHNAETVTENAAAGIWTFQHTYITPCISSLGEAVDSCTSVCLGDREERARRQRERARGAHRTRAEYSFDFYDDWYDDYYNGGLDGLDGLGEDGEDGLDTAGGGATAAVNGSGFGSIFGRGFLGTWTGASREDWDRLLAGSGGRGSRRHGDVESGLGGVHSDDGAAAAAVIEHQPKPRCAMNYGTRGSAGVDARSNGSDDPTIIPSTSALGFLSRLPFRFGGRLRYRPSAANLREHPTKKGRSRSKKAHGRDMATRDEHEPLLGAAGLTTVERAGAEHDGLPRTAAARQRSGTTGSGDTSDSFRSRGDLFPSDEEGDEDAVPLDDEFAVALDRVDDRSSGARTRYSSSSSLVGLNQAAASGPTGPAGSGGSAGGRRKSKGKRRADTMTSTRSGLSCAVSYTTVEGSVPSSQASLASPAGSIRPRVSAASLRPRTDAASVQEDVVAEEAADHERVLEMLQREDARAAHEEDVAVERKRQAAAQLARERGLVVAGTADAGGEPTAETTEPKPKLRPEPESRKTRAKAPVPAPAVESLPSEPKPRTDDVPSHVHHPFVPARLPHFG